MKGLFAATVLVAGLARATLAGDVQFRDTVGVTDTRTGETSVFTRVENDTASDQDVFVTRNGVRRKVGTLRPGGKASVTVIPQGDGVFLWNEESD